MAHTKYIKRSVEDVAAGLALRQQAMDLLQQAEALDGLKPYLAVHNHSSGIETEQMVWASNVPTQAELKMLFSEKFDQEYSRLVS